MNLMSSMAKTLVGSSMAMVSFAPALEMGRMVYLRATSAGMILITASSTSTRSRFTDGTPKCLERKSVSFSSVTIPILTRFVPRRPPSFFCRARASVSCFWLMVPEETSSSPSLLIVGARSITHPPARFARLPPPSRPPPLCWFPPLSPHPPSPLGAGGATALPRAGSTGTNQSECASGNQRGRELEQAGLGLGEAAMAEAAGEPLVEHAVGRQVRTVAHRVGGAVQSEHRHSERVGQVQ